MRKLWNVFAWNGRGPELPFRKTTTLMYEKFSSKIFYDNSIIPAVYRLNDKHL